MSMIFKSYEERIENKNGEISKTSKMTTHNGKKGVEILTKNGKTRKKKFKVNKKTLPKNKMSGLMLPRLIVSIPIHKVNDQDILTKKLKSQKKRKRKTKRGKKRRKKRRKKTIKKKPFWKKFIGV